MNDDWLSDGRKVPDDVMSYFRKAVVRAVKEKGYSPELVAEVFGFSRSCVYDWLARFDREGYEALETRVAPGAEPKLTEEIEDWLKAVVLNSTPMEHGYDTVLGERGVTLSGGQKQRAAIARAVARDPRILILDDALSSVDTNTEEQILARLRDVMATRTAILISHRISTVRHADQIIVVDDGRIVERGTHDELLSRGGLYADLYEKQLLEEALEETNVETAT